jgi:hypothetical protein
MSYFKEVDTWLDELLQYVATNPPKEELEQCKKDIKGELLKSYRNGQAAGEKKAQAPHEASHEGSQGEAPAALRAGERRRPHRPR